MSTFGADIPFVDHCAIEALGVEDGRTKLRIVLKPFHGNNLGIPHGGLVATLLDVAMGTAARNHVGRPVMTVDMSVAFLAGGQGTLLAEGRVLKAGRSIVFTEAEIRDESGTLIAKSSGTMKPIREAAA